MSAISSVEKAFDLLEFLASMGRAASLQEVTAAAQLPKPTVCRLLNSLQTLGYVSRPHRSREYLLGPRVARLTGFDAHAALKATARPLLRHLHGELNETVNLGTLSGTQVLYLEFVETTRPLRYIVNPGENDPYYSTALGRAIAATLDDAGLERLLQQTTLRRLTADTVRTKAELREKILRVRENGFSEETNEAADGVGCLAVDLKFLGFPEAAISVAVPLHRLTARRRTQILQILKSLPQVLHTHE